MDRQSASRRGDSLGESQMLAGGMAGGNQKQVYKSSKGFRVILNSIDERKVNNVKKVQNSNNFASALFPVGSSKRKDEQVDGGTRIKEQVQRNSSL